MDKVSLKKLNSPDTVQGVKNAVAAAGFVPFNAKQDSITYSAIFKGKERHTRRRKKDGGCSIILQSYQKCEGAQGKIFIALSVDGGKGKNLKHISCDVYVKNIAVNKKDLY
ncbi:MAG: hypothetical protein LUD19_03905 [Clostridia bacterium]|nr:hypothetical protein [Clostridia bacterium]